MPSHFDWLPAPVRAWFADSPPMTRREFYALFAVLFVLITISLAAVVHYAGENRQRAEEGRQAHAVACARKASLQARIAETQSFMDNGGRIPGVSSVLLQRGIDRDRGELKAFVAVHCEFDERNP